MQTIDPQAKEETLLSESPRKISFLIMFTVLGILGAITIPAWLFFNNSQSSSFITYENEDIRVDYLRNWRRENKATF